MSVVGVNFGRTIHRGTLPSGVSAKDNRRGESNSPRRSRESGSATTSKERAGTAEPRSAHILSELLAHHQDEAAAWQTKTNDRSEEVALISQMFFTRHTRFVRALKKILPVMHDAQATRGNGESGKDRLNSRSTSDRCDQRRHVATGHLRTGTAMALCAGFLFFTGQVMDASNVPGGTSRARSLSRNSITDSAAVAAILGEASNQGQRGLLAVACAIRNRGTLTGVYGVNNPIVLRASPTLRAQAIRAWRQSARTDITGGATYWGNKTDIQTAKFYARLTFTRKIGDHYFFKA